MNKILFISHDANMGGAQILLLNLTKALIKTGKFDIEFLLMRGGEFRHDFELLAKTYLYKSAQKSRGMKAKIKSLFNSRVSNVSLPNWCEYDCIISNTITNGDIFDEIRQNYKGPLLSYIHELQISSQIFSTPQNIKKVIDLSNHFLVPCNALAMFLKRSYKVPDEKITILPYYFPSKKTNQLLNNESTSKFIVAGTGTTDWRKGPDLFIQIAARVRVLEPSEAITFIWKGSQVGSLEHSKLVYDIDKLNLKAMVSFEKPLKELDLFFETVKVFLLTSREDPYPLVVLQAANHKIPIVCFKEAGGIPEFIGNSKGGICVDYLNIDKAAEAIVYYFNNENKRKESGNLAKEYLYLTHQNINEFSDRLLNVIQKTGICN